MLASFYRDALVVMTAVVLVIVVTGKVVVVTALKVTVSMVTVVRLRWMLGMTMAIVAMGML